MIRVEALTGPALEAALDDVARLRMAVFRDWPYLYDGDMDYERRYVASYKGSPGAILVGAFDGARLVGASTGTPRQSGAGAPFSARRISLAVSAPSPSVFIAAATALAACGSP